LIAHNPKTSIDLERLREQDYQKQKSYDRADEHKQEKKEGSLFY